MTRPLLGPVLAIGAILIVERAAFQVGRNLLPLLREEFGDVVGYLPAVSSLGSVLGCIAWLVAGVLGAGRRWAIGFLAVVVVAGAIRTVAPTVALLVGASALAGFAGYGGSILLASTCERLADESRRRDLNHRVSGLGLVGAPVLAAGLTLLATGGDWRLATAVGAVALPALALAPLVSGHLAARPRVTERTPRVELRRALRDARGQLRDPAVVRGAVAGGLTALALSPLTALLTLALADDGIGLGVVTAITLLAIPIPLVGNVWERWLGHRPRGELVASFGPAGFGCLLVLVVETVGAAWAEPVRIGSWVVAALAVQFGIFTVSLVVRGLALSVGDGPIAAGAISVRTALQALPVTVAYVIALGAAPTLYALGFGLAPSAILGLGLLIGAVLTLHRART